MNQTDWQGETERALRALTCRECANGTPLYDAKHHHGRGAASVLPCTYNPELLPLFNAGVAGAYAAAAKLCADVTAPFTLDKENNRVYLPVEIVTAELAKLILALTPADARQAQEQALKQAKKDALNATLTTSGIVALSQEVGIIAQSGPYCIGCECRLIESQVTEHIKACPKHPAREWERAAIASAEARQQDINNEAFHALSAKLDDIRLVLNRLYISKTGHALDFREQLASAEARARLDEHVPYCKDCMFANPDDYCTRGRKLYEAARTPDRSKTNV